MMTKENNVQEDVNAPKSKKTGNEVQEKQQIESLIDWLYGKVKETTPNNSPSNPLPELIKPTPLEPNPLLSASSKVEAAKNQTDRPLEQKEEQQNRQTPAPE